jgi:phage FluMu protein Com
MDGLLMKEEVIKCKSITNRKGTPHECGRFIAKFINKTHVHIKCPACPSYTVIRIVDGEFDIVHVDKQGEAKICQKTIKQD